MDDEAAEAAEGMSAQAIRQALEVLRLKWGERFVFRYDPDRVPVGRAEVFGWWVVERGRIGSFLSADSPDELDAMLTDLKGTNL
jgi:hypothetical protein